MGYIETLTNVFVSPQQGMKEIAERKGLGFLWLGVIVSAFSSALTAYSAQSILPKVVFEGPNPFAEGQGQIIIIFSVIVATIGALIGLLIYTALLTLGPWYYGGKGKFTKLLETVSIANLPTVFSAIATSVNYLTISSQINQVTLEEYQQLLMPTGPFLAISIVTSLWFLFLAYHAVKAVHQLDDKKALTSIIPLAILQLGGYILAYAGTLMSGGQSQQGSGMVVRVN